MPNYPLPVEQQPNIVTAARYEYTLWEKRILYQVIAQLNKEVKKGATEADLFNNRVIRMPIKDVIGGSSDKLKEAKKAVISLRMKSFEIITNKGTPQECWEESGFIYRSKISEGIIEVVISELLMPHLIDLTKKFTRYSPFTAMILRSTYSQRFYEFCCRFRDTGHWYVSVEELREMLKTEDKYGTFGLLKQNVIEKARIELVELYEKSESDVCFTYAEVKKSRAITHIKFKILAKEKSKGAKESTLEEINIVNVYIKFLWPGDKNEARRINIFNKLSEVKGFKEFKEKADDISKRYPNNSSEKNAPILIKAMKEDYGISL